MKNENGAHNAESALQPFLRGFTARDLAESLPSFDEVTSLVQIASACDALQCPVIGIRRAGRVSGWLSRDDIAMGVEPSNCRPFDQASILSESTSLNEVVCGLNAAPHVFVRGLGEVVGVIGRQDIEKPAMRMWLFGLVTVSELRVTQLIDELCPQDAWQEYLSSGRLQKSLELQQERRRRGQERSLLHCLQFADKGQIVARNEELRQRTRFTSRREVEEFVAALQDLRNNLAHAQEIAGDWEVIHSLALNLHRIVLGPDEPTLQPPLANPESSED